MRQLAHLMLPRRRLDCIRQPAVGNDGVGANCNFTGRRHQPAADIAERIEIARNRERRRHTQVIRLHEVARARRMHIEHQHEGSLLGELVDELETDADQHEFMSRDCGGVG